MYQKQIKFTWTYHALLRIKERIDKRAFLSDLDIKVKYNELLQNPLMVRPSDKNCMMYVVEDENGDQIKFIIDDKNVIRTVYD